jgi:hypothetical protein
MVEIVMGVSSHGCEVGDDRSGGTDTDVIQVER